MIQTVKAQESDGIIRVTIPADARRQFKIEKGDQITIYGQSGDQEITVGKASKLF